MSKSILDALSKLDPANLNHWTQDGLPRLDTIKILSGDATLTREAVTAAAPEFNRESALAGHAGAGGSTLPGKVPQAQPAPNGGATGAGSGTGAGLPVLSQQPVAEEVNGQEELQAKITDAHLNLSDRQDALQLAKQELTDAQNLLAELEGQLKEAVSSGVNPITQYLKRQQKTLEERGARKALIAESGLDLKQLAKDLKSPIDAAMERRTGRGGSRPVRS